MTLKPKTIATVALLCATMTLQVAHAAPEYLMRLPVEGLKASSAPASPGTPVAPSAPAPAPAWEVTGTAGGIFAATLVGAMAPEAALYTVSNTGTGVGSLAFEGVGGTNPSDFPASSTCSNVPAGGTCAISVRFQPTAGGARTSTLTLPGRATLTLAGTGVVPETGFTIVYGSYGYNVGLGANLDTKLTALCNDKTSCNFNPLTLIGDPAVNKVKYLKVDYRCNGELRRYTFDTKEAGTVTHRLSCPF